MIPHRARLGHRHIIVGIAVQNVNTVVQIVAGKGERVGGSGSPLKELLPPVPGLFTIRSGVGPKADPTRARRNRGKSVREGHAKLPRAMSAHGVSSQINLVRIGLEPGLRQGEDFHGIMPAPILPIEAIWSAIRRRDHRAPGFGRITCRLSQGFHGSSVSRKKQRLRWPVPGQRLRRGNRKILNAAINVAAEGLSQILALVASDEKMRDAAPAPLSLSKRLPKIHALTVKWQRNLLMERHFLHPAFYSAGNQNALLAVL